MTFVLTFIYLHSIEKFRDIPFEAENKHMLEGLSNTMLFLFFVVLGFCIDFPFSLPKDIEKHVEEIY